MVLSDKDLDKIRSTIISTFKEVLSREIEEMITKQVTEKVTQECAQLNKGVTKMGTEVRDLKADNSKLYAILDDQEQNARSQNVRIFGVETSDGEDTRKIVLDLLNKKMKCGIKDSEIKKCFRVPAKNPSDKPPAILVQFFNDTSRTAVLVNRKQNPVTGVSVKEDLTKRRLDLLHRAVSKYTLKNAWTLRGNVYIRDNEGIRRINSVSDL